MTALQSRVLTTARTGSPEWLKMHAGKIGGSMVADILAPGKPGTYGTPLQAFTRLQAELQGRAPEDIQDSDLEGDFDEDEERVSERDEFEWGNETEEMHMRMLSKRIGSPVQRLQMLVRDDGYPWFVVTPDSEVCEVDVPDDERALAELKAPLFKKKLWVDGAPLGYQLQGAAQMRVIKRDRCVISALMPPVKWQMTYRSPEIEEWMMAGLVSFWEDHVMRDLPPPPSGVADLAAIESLYRPVPTKIISAPSAQLVDAAFMYVAEKAAASQHEKNAKALRTDIIAQMQDAGGVCLPDGTMLKRTLVIQNRAAQEARMIESKRLTLVKPKS